MTLTAVASVLGSSRLPADSNTFGLHVETAFFEFVRYKREVGEAVDVDAPTNSVEMSSIPRGRSSLDGRHVSR